MTTAQAPKTNRRAKTSTSSRRAASAGRTSSLSVFYQRRQDAVEAARSKGVQEVEVSFSIPGARFVATVKIEDLEVAVLERPGKTKTALKADKLIPTEKLRKAIEEAKDVKVFYKSPEELFDALEKQD